MNTAFTIIISPHYTRMDSPVSIVLLSKYVYSLDRVGNRACFSCLSSGRFHFQPFSRHPGPADTGEVIIEIRARRAVCSQEVRFALQAPIKLRQLR